MTVYVEITENAWLHYSLRQITNVDSIHELVQLRGMLSQTMLDENEDDKNCWTRNNTGEYTTQSAYCFQFLGS